MQEFKTPDDILAYGKMVDGFANAAKAIADLQNIAVPKDAVDAFAGIAAKTAAPNPGESPDIRPEVECLRRAYKLIQKNYDERLRSNKDKKTSYFGRTHRKSLDRLESFLSLLEAHDCNADKLRDRYLSPEVSHAPGFAERIAAETNNDQSRSV